jgi:hypothetical protein
LPRFPSPDQYQRAVAARAFADADLRAGRPADGLFGLPQLICGAFAAVFPFHAAGSKCALRCFLTPSPEREERYRHADEALRRAGLPSLLPFEYQPRGIHVDGEWYPLLKMAWAEGEDLQRHVEARRHDRKALAELTRQVLAVAGELERHGLAHGDLQHGNVLVCAGGLKLIDYDALFVPALRGRPTAEIGHVNYQHPGRDRDLFGEGMDRFSVWVICLSLLALRAAPELWGRHGGDDRLLFRAADFRQPAGSPLLAELLASPDPTVRGLAAAFVQALALPAAQCPAIDRHLVARPGRSVAREVYLSYAWGDDGTPEGLRRGEVVQQLEACLARRGHRVVRDRSAMRAGDWVSTFMQAIGRANKVIVVLSDKYLRSPYCMEELYRLYQRAGGDKEEFLRRIVPVVLDDARIDGWQDRLGWGEHWRRVYEEMQARRDDLGRADDERRRLIRHWHQEVGDMLAYVADALAPRGYDAVVKDDFAAVREAIERDGG